MYAVIETGGKQYRVELGTELEIERLEAAPGETVAFDRVLLVADGDDRADRPPVVANALVTAEVLRQDRGEKLIIFKYRPKARRRVKKGHRQELTVLRISDIVLDGKSAASEVAKAEEAAEPSASSLEEAAARQAEQDAALAAKLAAEKPRRSRRTTTAKAQGRPPKRTAQGRADGQGEDRRADRRRRRPTATAKADTTDKGAKSAGHDEGDRRPQASDEEGLTDGTQEGGRLRRTAATASASDSASRPVTARPCSAGSIIVRQRGMTFLAGPGTDLGGDYTLFATTDGKVKFEHARRTRSASGSSRPRRSRRRSTA